MVKKNLKNKKSKQLVNKAHKPFLHKNEVFNNFEYRYDQHKNTYLLFKCINTFCNGKLKIFNNGDKMTSSHKPRCRTANSNFKYNVIKKIGEPKNVRSKVNVIKGKSEIHCKK